jgi:hypothetical protein
MKTWIHAEWDDTQLSVLLVQGRGKRAKVTARRVTCTAAAEALGKTLAEACGEAMKGKVELVLAVNDRRFVCGSAAPGGKDLAATVFEDARKNGLMGQPDECLVGYVPRGKALGYCVAPRSLVEELDRGLVAAGFQRRRITAGEVVTANLSQDEEAIGVLDLREGRGTFTLAANGLPLASRRLRLPGNAGSRPWEDPARVFVTGNVEGSSAMVITAMTTMLSTAVAYPERAAVERVVDAGLPLTWVVPALASVLEPRSLPSVVEPRYLSRVEKTVITVSQTLAAACLGVGAWIGWQACQPSVDELRRTLASKTTELTAARVEVDRLRTEKAVPELVMQRRRVLAQRADDRSVSLLLAGVAAAMPPGAKLTQLELEPDQKLTIEGLFAANASPGPVESFAAFDRRLRGLPGVRSSGGNVDPPGEHGLARFESWVSPKEKP